MERSDTSSDIWRSVGGCVISGLTTLRLDLLERVYVMQQISTEPVELDLSVGFIHCEIVKGLIDAVEPFDFLTRKKMGDMPP